MKKLILSVLLFLLVASSTGCTILNDSQSSIENDDKLIIDQTSTKNTSDVLIQALETNDAELFKSVFLVHFLKLQPDIDEGIKYIFNIFEGDNLEIVYENQSSESFSDLQAKCVWSICVIKTTEKCYSLTWTEWVQQETDPSAQGVYSLIFEECEEDQRGAGGGDLLAGIYYPGCETESDILNTFFGAMHNKDREELETIFSNEFLENPEAVKNMDKFIERCTPSYSNLLAAWEVNDTICIQLRRFDAFICLHFDNKQTDKISSIRVFDSTTEDEESISQYDFNQDEMGIYFPD